ncbi:hypothetical protein AVEN_160317-1 [Araneus ventricosus]|uniref:Uncharacterized protein n=1 Tax=Araneus ventricosus TaxID=182803 RepID=A0A4Y2FAP8_ARAVE|nr:hypothetical protein AVEN_160317-1 [Araneus ventricosus]
MQQKIDSLPSLGNHGISSQSSIFLHSKIMKHKNGLKKAINLRNMLYKNCLKVYPSIMMQASHHRRSNLSETAKHFLYGCHSYRNIGNNILIRIRQEYHHRWGSSYGQTGKSSNMEHRQTTPVTGEY